MEHLKILNLLNQASNSKFVTRKGKLVNDQSNANYDVGNEMIYKKSFKIYSLWLQWCLHFRKRWYYCHSSSCNKNIWNNNRWCWRFSFTNVNLIEYSSNSPEKTGNVWFYSKDEANNFNNSIENTDNFKYFKYKAKLLENTVAQPAPNQANGILRNATVAVLLKYLSNFWRSLEMPLINCKVDKVLHFDCKWQW